LFLKITFAKGSHNLVRKSDIWWIVCQMCSQQNLQAIYVDKYVPIAFFICDFRYGIAQDF